MISVAALNPLAKNRTLKAQQLRTNSYDTRGAYQTKPSSQSLQGGSNSKGTVSRLSKKNSDSRNNLNRETISSGLIDRIISSPEVVLTRPNKAQIREFNLKTLKDEDTKHKRGPLYRSSILQNVGTVESSNLHTKGKQILFLSLDFV